VAVSGASRRLHLGSGSVIGGRVGLLVAPDLLRALGVGRDVALVSGTNGKTTTTRMLAAALGGVARVATSSAGANLPPGLAAALAAAEPGMPAVLEVDEGYVGQVARALRPRVVALLNLSRDQLDRMSEVRMLAGRWRAALGDGSDAVVVANADDPLVAWGAGTAPHVLWVAAGQLWRQDAVGCPACDGHIVFAPDAGDWWCTCGFRRPAPDAVLAGHELVMGDGRRLPVVLALPGRCNRANAAMAAVAAGVLGVDEAGALRAMAALRDVEGRFATLRHGALDVRLLLAKNPAGWTELFDLLDGGRAPVVIGINARIADGHDPSWLWDVSFERLGGRFVVATGERCRDLAVRLRHAGVAHVTVPNQIEALGAPRATRVEYVGNYTAFQGLRRALARRGASAVAPDAVAVPGTEAAPATAAGAPSGAPAPPAPVVAVTATGQPVEAWAAAAPSGASRPGPPRRDGAAGPSALRVVVVHPDLLGTYGDGGNGRVLADRASWRGVPVELVHAYSDTPLPSAADIYCLGGGEDGPEVRSAERLADGALARAVDHGAVVLAVCAGYQVIGESFPGADGRPHAGAGLLDVVTVKGTGRRAVGELLAEPLVLELPAPGAGAVGLERLTGFENHGDVTRLGPGVRPFARVLVGVGNGAGDGTEGAQRDRVFGTYLHGPVLARNPSFADVLLSLATGTVPAALEDGEEEALRAERLGALAHRRRPGAGVLGRRRPAASVAVRRP